MSLAMAANAVPALGIEEQVSVIAVSKSLADGEHVRTEAPAAAESMAPLAFTERWLAMPGNEGYTEKDRRFLHRAPRVYDEEDIIEWDGGRYVIKRIREQRQGIFTSYYARLMQ